MSAMPTIMATRLERYMRIVKDLKKEINFYKNEGVWRCDDEPNEVFQTFWACVCNVVGPYVEEMDRKE